MDKIVSYTVKYQNVPFSGQFWPVQKPHIFEKANNYLPAQKILIFLQTILVLQII